MFTLPVSNLSAARYFPFDGGRYVVKAGLHRFGRDFGNGSHDGQVFQFDRHAGRYLENKTRCLDRDCGTFYATDDFDGAPREVVCDFLDARLRLDQPDADLVDSGDRYDRLARSVQEDVCVIRLEGDRNWLAAAHVCAPNGWSARQKIGLPFDALHEPVPHAGPIVAASAAHVRGMINAVGGMVRFAWGVRFDDRLDHLPEEPEPTTVALADAHVRVERQTIWGLPTARAAVFTIRTYFYRCLDLPSKHRLSLASAIESMSEASRAYKGLTRWGDPLVRYLRADREA